MEYQGNTEILNLPQHGFLCSRSTKSTVILPCLDWAARMARGNEAVMSTFHSEMERAVLDILIDGTCPIVLVLGRSLYKSLPQHLTPLMEGGRLLIVSLSNQGRISKESALRCNEYIVQNSSTLTFGFLSPKSSLQELYAKALESNISTTILETL